MVEAMDSEQYYYYNAGVTGGEISAFSVGTILTVKGLTGVITKVSNLGNGVKAAKVVMQNGDEVVAVIGKEGDDIAIVAASKLDDVADAGNTVKHLNTIFKGGKVSLDDLLLEDDSENVNFSEKQFEI